MKLTLEKLHALIKSVRYVQKGELGELGTTTLCILTLHSGFVVTGTSACIDPDKFDPEIGEKVAYDDAVNQLWELEGYHAVRMNGRDYLYRLRLERDMLAEKLEKLTALLSRERPYFLSQREFDLLFVQRDAMAKYLHVLNDRIDLPKQE